MAFSDTSMCTNTDVHAGVVDQQTGQLWIQVDRTWAITSDRHLWSRCEDSRYLSVPAKEFIDIERNPSAKIIGVIDELGGIAAIDPESNNVRAAFDDE